MTAICAIADMCFDTGTGNKLMRLVGTFNDDPDSLMKQYFPTSSSVQHPLHHHVFTFLTGDECDITACIPTFSSRPSRRQRLDAESNAINTDDGRTFTVAPWLDPVEEQTYVSLAGTLLGRFGMTGGFQLGRLKGYQVYGTTVTAVGRNCAYGPKHNSNNFFVAFEKSGNVTYRCYGSECLARQPLCLGQWCSGLDATLVSSEMFAPGPNLDATLLHNLKQLAVKNTPRKQKISQQPWYDELEQRVCAYLSKYFVFVSAPAVYVRQTLDIDGGVFDYVRYTASQLKSVTKPYAWGFDIWDNSYLRETMATKVKFVGNPWDCRVRPQEYNLCAGMMPLLKQSKRILSEEDIQELQPILDHIKDCLCAGNQQDYTNLLAWLAHIMQDPAEKTGWCPVSSLTSSSPFAGKISYSPEALSILTKGLLCRF